MSSIRVVCFDLGGVLIRINYDWEGALEIAGFAHLRKTPARGLTDMPGLEQYQSGQMSEESYLSDLASFLRLQDSDEATRVHAGILRQSYQGTFELIESLKTRGLRVGCLSNTNRIHWNEMLTSPRFPNVQALHLQLASHELMLSKPDAAIYHAFEHAAQADADQIVFFDDNLPNVQAAKALGWNAYLIDPSLETVPQMVRYLAIHGLDA